MMKRLIITVCLLIFVYSARTLGKPNILFIGIDDLRTELGCYGSEIAVTPNLDTLAREGLVFDRAYCQQAICAPSRASLMTGARPDTTGITHNYVKIRQLNPNIVTLPQHLIANGYETVYCGKIFHPGDTDEKYSWSRQPATDKVQVEKFDLIRGYALPENQKVAQKNLDQMLARYGDAARQGFGNGPAYESADVPDHVNPDGYNTELAIATLKEMVDEGGKPFFLALGFRKPHLNWNAPKKYWDLYDRSEIPLSRQADGPEDGAAMGLHASFELRTRYGIPKSGPIEQTHLSNWLISTRLYATWLASPNRSTWRARVSDPFSKTPVLIGKPRFSASTRTPRSENGLQIHSRWLCVRPSLARLSKKSKNVLSSS